MKIRDEHGNLICYIYKKEDRSNAGTLKFITEPNDALQVGMWDAYEDKSLTAHAHLAGKTVKRMQEMFYIESGKIIAYIYDDSGKEIDSIVLCPGDIMIQVTGGHSFLVRGGEEKTTVIECKNGPYLGADDKIQIKEKINE